jgi:hypothetical protein
MKRYSRTQDARNFLLQLEYGMLQWKRRGMELELLAIHRELDEARMRAFKNTEIERALDESYRNNKRTIAALEDTRKTLKQLDDLAVSLRSRNTSLASSLSSYRDHAQTETTEANDVIQDLSQSTTTRTTRKVQDRISQETNTTLRSALTSISRPTTPTTATSVSRPNTPRKTVHFQSPILPDMIEFGSPSSP